MMNTFRMILSTAVTIAFAAVCATQLLMAQESEGSQNRVGLNIFAGSAFPTDEDPNEDALYGGGVELKYFLQDNVAVGAGMSYSAKSYDGTFVGVDYDLSSYVFPVYALAEFYFTKADNVARPYLGANLGVYNFGVTGNVAGVDFDPDPESFFGIAPKFGLQLNLGEQLGAFGEFGYNVVFDKEDSSGDGSPANADFEDVATKFYSLHLGAALRF